jgi:serine/threonine protein kinase
LSVELLVDQACDRFEAAWNAGSRPALEDYLAGVPEADTGAFLRALLALEIALRRREDDEPSPAEYEQRFARHHELVRFVFAREATAEFDPEGADGPGAGPAAGPNQRRAADLAGATTVDSDPVLPARIGRYQVRGKLGAGAFGSVYLADDEVMERQVAIKVPSLRLLASQAARDQFLSEARSVARLRHEGIVRAHDFGQEADDRCYIVYEFIDGTNLKERIRPERLAAEPLGPAAAAAIVAPLAEALHYAHLQGLVHRDVKPANILLDRRGKPLLTDFGLAVREEDLWKERGRQAGTLPYMSPEQVRREGDLVDGRTDVYGLGVVLYELLCGRRPFDAELADELEHQILHREARPPRQVKDGIPPELERVCLRALSKRISDRYPTAEDMARELRNAIGEGRREPTKVISVSPAEFDRCLASADAAELVRLLRQVRLTADPVYVPRVFRCLGHSAEAVREQARKAVHAIGLEKVSDAAEDLGRRGDAPGVAAVLDGLDAFEAHPGVVALLDRLLVVLTGDLRNRAILLLERKRLGLELDAVAGLFREIQSPYRIVRALGQGLFAASYLAYAGESGLEVVVRVLRPELARQPDLRAQFLDLNKSALHWVHENLALTREARAFPGRGVYFAVRDYVDGVTLQRALEGGKAPDAGQAVRLLTQLAAALGVVHRRGTCHGGVKPSNVFLRTDDRAVLGDPSLPAQGVGIALSRLAYDYRYAAPEAFQGGGRPRPESDFYSLGCVGYELVCGAPPFVADNYMELAASHLHKDLVAPSRRGGRAGPELERVLLRLLARNPADRYATADEVVAALNSPLSRRGRTAGAAETAAPLLRDTSLERLRPVESVVGFGAPEASIQSLTPDASGARPGGEDLTAEGDVIGRRRQPPGDAGVAAPVTEASPGTPQRVGDYEILETIGRGGMGVVYKARDPRLQRVVALKVLASGSMDLVRRLLVGDDAYRLRSTRLQTEARAVARLQHPNIVHVYDIGESEGLPYVVLEYVAGGSLADRLRAQLPPPREAAATVALLARAVQHAHEQGVLHRDLKPSNVLLTGDGHPKIADFGLAKVREMSGEEATQTLPGMILGTPSYMAPEQAAGKIEAIGPAADVYGLGAILYESLTGGPPFRGASAFETLSRLATEQPVPPDALNRAVDRGLGAICLKCLEKKPQDRYASASALAGDLERWLQGEPAVAAPVRPAGGFLRWFERVFIGFFPTRVRKQR